MAMNIQVLSENQEINVTAEDLIIECDIPKGVRINVTNGDIVIQKSVVGEDVKIFAFRTRLVNLKGKNGSVFIADYATTDMECHGLKMSGAVQWGHYGALIVIDGEEMLIPTVATRPVLKGNVTVLGNITKTTDIRASDEVKVAGKKMVVLKLEEEVLDQDVLLSLLLNKDTYENVYLLKALCTAEILSRKFQFESPLMSAARNGYRQYVEELLLSGVDVNEETIFAQTALSTALENGHLAIAELLIDAKCNIQPRRYWARSILYYAEQGGCKEQFIELLKRKNIVLEEQKLNDSSRLGFSSEFGNVNRPSGASNSNNNSASLDQHSSSTALSEPRFRSPFEKTLISVAKAGDISSVREFLASGSDVNEETSFNDTPLTQALKGGHLAIAELLIDAKCNIQPQGPFAEPILCYAEKGGCKKEFIALLLKKKNLFSKAHFDMRRKTPRETSFTKALEDNDLDFVELLIDVGCEIQPQGYFAKPILCYAEKGCCKKEFIALLLKKKNLLSKAHFDITGESGRETSLTKALEDNDFDFVELLIDVGCEIQARGRFIRPILNHAKKGNCEEQFIALLRKKNIVLQETEQINLMKAASIGDVYYVKEFILAGADINQKTSFNATPVTKALQNGHLTVVACLIEAGCKIQPESFFAKPILEYAKEGNCEKEFIALLESKNITLGDKHKIENPYELTYTPFQASSSSTTIGSIIGATKLSNKNVCQSNNN